MKVGMLLRAPFPPDVRVANEARALAGAGHEVHLLCLQDTERAEPAEERSDSLWIHRLPPVAGALRKVNGATYKLSFIDPWWLKATRRAVHRHGFEVLHVHDLPLVRTALWAARGCRIPLVFDAHEMWPEEVRQWIVPTSWMERHSIYSYERTKRIERQCFRDSSFVIVPAEGRLRPVLQAGVPRERIAVVPNYVDDTIYDPTLYPGAAERAGKDPTVLYIGSLPRQRGIDTLIGAMVTVRRVCPKATLHLRGALHCFDRLWLDDLIRHTGDPGCVELLDRGDFSRTPEYFLACDVFVIPFPATLVTHHFAAINKVFEAMAMARPLVVTDITDFRPAVEEAQCGLVVPPSDPEAMGKAIVRILKDTELARQLGRNGRRAVEERYNQRISAPAQRLRSLYAELEAEAVGNRGAR